MRRPHLNILLTGGLLAALLAGIGLSHWLNQQPAPEGTGLILSQPRAIPDFMLQTAAGTPYTRDHLSGHWQLLFFGFTHCPDVCPNTLALMKQLKQDLPAAVSGQLDFVFVSIDPARDTPQVLREYIDYFDPEFLGITGSSTQLASFTESLGIAYVTQAADENGNYNVDHSTAMVLLTPAAAVQAYFPAPHKLTALNTTLTGLIGS